MGLQFETVYPRKDLMIQWHLSKNLKAGKSHGQRSLVGYSPWGHKELDTTKRLHFTSPSVMGNHWRVLSTGIMDIL